MVKIASTSKGNEPITHVITGQTFASIGHAMIIGLVCPGSDIFGHD